jgi:hypothetical protein
MLILNLLHLSQNHNLGHLLYFYSDPLYLRILSLQVDDGSLLSALTVIIQLLAKQNFKVESIDLTGLHLSLLSLTTQK